MDNRCLAKGDIARVELVLSAGAGATQGQHSLDERWMVEPLKIVNCTKGCKNIEL